MSDSGSSRAYWVLRPGCGELQAQPISPSGAAGESLVRSEFGTVSAGTERLVGLGHVPVDCHGSMNCAYMGGSFAFPISYGYCIVGRVEQGGLLGRRVFVMHPHQERAWVRDEDLVLLPDEVPAHHAVLFPNLETALNAVWDAEIEATDRVAIVGGGALGCLVAFALQHESSLGAIVFELAAERRQAIAELEWIQECSSPEAANPGSFDVVFDCSGNPEALRFALSLAGFEGRVIALSWYGDREVRLELGSDFHTERKRIIASQVAHVARAKRKTLGHAGRRDRVLELLTDAALESLIGPRVQFEQLPQFMESVYRGAVTALVPLLTYPSDSQETD